MSSPRRANSWSSFAWPRRSSTTGTATIFLGMHFGNRTRQSLATQFDLTAPGVTHVYRTTAKRLHDHPRFQRYAEGGAP